MAFDGKWLLHTSQFTINMKFGITRYWPSKAGDYFIEATASRFSVFSIVEKATMLARCMESDNIMHNKTIKTAFAHIFCLLIGSLEDLNAAVSQRTIQYLETIKASSIQVT